MWRIVDFDFDLITKYDMTWSIFESAVINVEIQYNTYRCIRSYLDVQKKKKYKKKETTRQSFKSEPSNNRNDYICTTLFLNV